MKKNILIFIGFTISLLILSSCVKEEFDELPSDCYELNLTANATIQDLKDYYNGSDTMKIDTNLILKVTVISSDKEGNIYKELIVQDETGGVSIQIDKKYLYETYPFGEIIYIKCENLYLDEGGGGIMELGLLYEENGEIAHGRIPDDGSIEEHLFRTCTNIPLEPKTYTIHELKTNDTLLNTLVKIENVQFSNSVLELKYADYDPYDPGSGERPVIDTAMNDLTLYNSGFAHFANLPIPEGSGSIIAIYGKYSSTYQLYINSVSDVNFDGERWGTITIFQEGFENSLGMFNAFSISGSGEWEHESYDDGCAKMQGSSNEEDWLVSSSINLTERVNTILTFRHALNYITSWDDLHVLISTDYDGTSEPNSNGTWIEITDYDKPSGNSWTFYDSGEIDISQFDGESSVYVAFKYTCGSNSSVWEIGEVGIIVDAK